MRLTANLCTYKNRIDIVNKAIDSILPQVDAVRCYYNDYIPDQRYNVIQHIGQDLTDRAKFTHIQDDEIVFICDDDIKYAPNYVEYTLDKIKKYGGIVTYHGRKLNGLNRRYYYDHRSYHFRWHLGQEDTPVDVPGTGVMAYNTNDFYFDPYKYTENKMVDLLVGLEAAKQDVPITCIRNQDNWIMPIATDENIHDSFKKDSEQQNNIADMILKLKNN